MVEIHPERYRSGHNGADSKAARFRPSVQRESFGFLAKAPFSCDFRDFGLQEKEKAPYSCLSKFAQNSIRRDIEEVITGLTRNQFF